MVPLLSWYTAEFDEKDWPLTGCTACEMTGMRSPTLLSFVLLLAGHGRDPKHSQVPSFPSPKEQKYPADPSCFFSALLVSCDLVGSS